MARVVVNFQEIVDLGRAGAGRSILEGSA